MKRGDAPYDLMRKRATEFVGDDTHIVQHDTENPNSGVSFADTRGRVSLRGLTIGGCIYAETDCHGRKRPRNDKHLVKV